MKSTLTIVGLIFALNFTQAEHVPATIKSLEDSPQNNRNLTFLPVIKWMTQKLDQFNYSDDRTFEMAYMVNEIYYKSGGPIFIYLYGAHPITPWKNDHGIIVDLAKKYNGMLFYPEHRFYGRSKPTMRQKYKDLQYLTVNQTMADLAHFIRTIRKNDARLEPSKIIISGCFYGGSLAVWFKKFHSDLVDGIWATDAPVLAKLDFHWYTRIVGVAFRKRGSDKCFNLIKSGIAQLEAMFAGNRSAEAAKMLHLCEKFDYTNNLDLSTLFNSITNVFGRIAEHQTTADILEHCQNLMNYQRDDATAVAKFYIKQMSNGQDCINVTYFNAMLPYRNECHGSERLWLFQQCNEFGWFATSSDKRQAFGSSVPLEYFTQMCHDAFDNKYTKEYMSGQVVKTNKYFGNKIHELKKAYVSVHKLNPWYPLGVLYGYNLIPDASRCADLGSITDFDSPAMRASKETLFKRVEEWLK